MPRLIAVRLPPAELAGEANRVWDAGDAILPLDVRAPGSEIDRVLIAAQPDEVIDSRGRRDLVGSPGVDEGVAAVIATSGTTGEPKLVELGHAALEASARASTKRIGWASSDRWLACVPLHRVAGLSILMRSRLAGTEPRILERFDPDDIKGADLVSVVPIMLRRLLDARIDLTSFRAVLVGGAALSPALRTRAEQAGARIITTYGMTETCGGCVYDGEPLDGVDIKMEDGEIALRGSMLFTRYRLHATHDGWYRTGDAGEIGEDGLLRVHGRLDDIIVTGGEKVAPAEVEAAVMELADVADAAVFGSPDETWGERVVAAIVPRDPASPPTLEDLRDRLRGTLSKAKLPTEIRLVTQVVRNQSGKVIKEALPPSDS